MTLATRKPAFKMFSSSDVQALPVRESTVKNLLPATGVACLFGPPGAGKTYIALEIAAAIANGHETLFGFKVRQRGVVVAALEGRDGFRGRLAAYEKHRQCKISDAARFTFPLGFSLRDDAHVESLAKSIGELGLGAHPVVMIDTLAAATFGMQENDTGEMGAVMARVRTLQERTGCLVILIAHTAKGNPDTTRGSSVLAGECDVMLQVGRPNKDSDTIELLVKKQRDYSSEGVCRRLRIEEVVLGIDDDGDEIKSAVIVSADDPVDSDRNTRNASPEGPRSTTKRRDKEATLGANESSVLRCLRELLSRPDLLDGRRPAVHLDELKEVVRPKLTCTPRKVGERLKAAVDSLHAKGLIDRDGDFVLSALAT